MSAREEIFEEPSIAPETLAGEVSTADADPADAGFHVEQEGGKRKRVWSFPATGEKRPEREPLSEEEWTRVLRGHARSMVYLVTREQREWAGNQARSCGACARVHLEGDPRRGFCLAHRMMTGITFPVLCRSYAE